MQRTSWTKPRVCLSKFQSCESRVINWASVVKCKAVACSRFSYRLAKLVMIVFLARRYASTAMAILLLMCFFVQASRAETLRDGLDVVVLLDDSGSLYGNKKSAAQDPAFVRLSAIQCLARKLRPTDRLAVIPFGSVTLSKYSIGFTSPGADFAAATKPLSDRAKVGAQAQDSTNYAAALESVESLLVREQKARKRIIMFLTDGEPNPRNLLNSDDKLIATCSRLKTNLDAAVYTISLGNNPKVGLLEQLSESSGGRHFHVSNPKDLPSVFADVIRYAGDREVRASIKENSFAIAPGTLWLNAVSVDSDGSRTMTFVSPSGKIFSGELDARIHPSGQREQVYFVSVDNPETGVWHIENADPTTDVSVASTLRVRILSPLSGDNKSSDEPIPLSVDVELFDGRGVLSGEAKVTGLTNAKPLVFPLTFSGNKGSVEIPPHSIDEGLHFIEVDVRQTDENKIVDAIPDRIELSLLKATPGVPTVSLQWSPDSNELRTAFGMPVSVSVPILANKEAQGKRILISVSQGWLVSPSTYTLNGLKSNLVVSLTPKSSFGRMNGDVLIKVSPDVNDLVVNNGNTKLHVTQYGWLDVVSAAIRFILIPVLLIVVFLSGMIVVSKQRSKLIRHYRKWLFEHVSITENGRNVLGEFNSKGGSMCRYGNIRDTNDGIVVNHPNCGWLTTNQQALGELFRLSIRMQKSGALMFINAPMTIEGNPTTRAALPKDVAVTIRINIGHAYTLTLTMRDDDQFIRKIRIYTLLYYALVVFIMLFIAVALYVVSGNVDQFSFSDANLG